MALCPYAAAKWSAVRCMTSPASTRAPSSSSTAATGMLAQQLNVDVISNNLANVNTTGFKKSRANFQDLIYQTLQRAGTSLWM